MKIADFFIIHKILRSGSYCNKAIACSYFLKILAHFANKTKEFLKFIQPYFVKLYFFLFFL
ncbi:hypothetical protein DYQ05_03630 [Treponema pedis]|nr:hypothetical protein DYQ05_03630 [Treponema pedis]